MRLSRQYPSASNTKFARPKLLETVRNLRSGRSGSTAPVFQQAAEPQCHRRMSAGMAAKAAPGAKCGLAEVAPTAQTLTVQTPIVQTTPPRNLAPARIQRFERSEPAAQKARIAGKGSTFQTSEKRSNTDCSVCHAECKRQIAIHAATGSTSRFRSPPALPAQSLPPRLRGHPARVTATARPAPRVPTREWCSNPCG